jgi:hypothetical protein
VEQEPHVFTIVTAGEYIVAMDVFATIPANRALIAAAPEMLEALKALIAYQADNETEYLGMQQIGSYPRAKAAIAKAEGRTEG